jgi:putative toxin-antitoxin system antitoxin component (TIGR02293 family)
VEESDRLLRLARVVERAVQVLGDRERARRWLTAPSPALGQAVPLALLDTDLGTHQVEELLGRIDFGVYS